MSVTVNVALGDEQYVLGPWVHSEPFFQASCSSRVLPTVIISIENSDCIEESIKAILTQFERDDDVFSRQFLTDTVILQLVETATIHLPTAAKALRRCGHEIGVIWDAKTIIVLLPSKLKEIPDGPYFIHCQSIFEAWKVYSDDCDAFQTTIIPNRSGPHDFSVLNAVSRDGNWKGVAVPSRLYHQPSSLRPLAGMRISIKDNIKLSGIATTCESQSFLDTYGSDTQTAAFISRLISLGAIVVGKTKLSAFASAENPPENWVDFRCPRNPRGDRYQQPTGSSTGAGASLAAYKWLDFAVGTDTVGSIRAPAAFCGLFGIRLSTHIAAPFEGIYQNSPDFDTLGLLGRDLRSLSHLAKVSLNEAIIDFSESSTADQEKIIWEFVTVLENFLNTKATKVSLAELWAKDPPKEAGGKSLVEFLETTVFNINYYDCYHEYDNFRKDHAQKFGTPPYVSPFIQWKWDLGKAVSRSGKDQSLKEMDIFKSWFNGHVLQPNKQTGSTAIAILPIAMTKPWYRYSPNPPPEASAPFTAMYLTTLVGMSQLVLPVAQTPYFSEVTERMEYIPFTASIAGAPGSDLMLLNLANAALEKASSPTKVLPGSMTFPIGDNVRKVGREHKSEGHGDDE